MKKVPLKTLIQNQGYTSDKAEKIIRSGKVKVNTTIVFMPNEKFLPNAVIEIKSSKSWVSRGAYKLLKAIEVFPIDFNNQVVLDIGASKGGFTDVALKYGADKIYALDVGTNQLDYSLRINPKVISLEKTNLKQMTIEMFADPIDIAVCDVSFIGLNEVFKASSRILAQSKKLLVLIKPQFEASSKYVQHGGYVDSQHHPFLIERVKQQAEPFFNFLGLEVSPIQGNRSKNIEYLALFERK